MSKFKANGDYGFVGVSGVPVMVSTGDEYDGEHALVQGRPEMFDEVPEEPKRPVLGRPRLKVADA